MSTSNSAEKNTPENNLQKRIIGLDRFNLSDEDLHNIRIHVAVFKYNNPKNNSCIRTMNDKRNQLLPFKRKLLKNSMKNKACDDNLDEARSLKRSCNRYQGVGNFPTVHLNKTPVVCRPIKKHVSNECKVQYPEVPMNRFINHIPDLNLDLKSSSTRSVLDVLQDLSRKRIHSKDDVDSSILKAKGLGGDAPLDIEAPFRPLFVQKPKNSTVLTKDSTTQTQEAIPSPEPPSSSSNNIISIPNLSDPKAELRRKLAKQNNEIFASLSSSLFSPYSIKRKLGKSQTLPENGLQEDDPSKKRPRLATKDLNLKISNDVGSKLNSSFGKVSNLEKSNKSFEKRKSLETSPRPSPGRDRLMNIYFDMQNGNPKADIFRNNDDTDKNQGTLGSPKKTVSFNEEVTVLTFNNNSKDESSDSAKDDDKSVSSSTSASSLASLPTSTTENKIDPPPFSFGETKISSPDISVADVIVSSTPSTTSDLSSPNAPSFNGNSSPTSSPGLIPLTSTVSSRMSQNPIFSTGMPSNQEKVATTPEKESFTPFNFGSSEKQTDGAAVDKPAGFSGFKFGSPNGNLGTTTTSPKETPAISSPLAIAATSSVSFSNLNSFTATAAVSTNDSQIQFPRFGSPSNLQTSEPAVTKPQFSFGQSSPISTAATTFKNNTPMFSFGQSQPNLSVAKTGSESSSTATGASVTSVQSTPIFGFGQKITQDKGLSGQNQIGIFGQNNNVLGSSNATSAATSVQNAVPVTTSAPFGLNAPQNITFGQNSSGSPFPFGQKTAQPDASGVKTDLFGAKPQANFPFTFGQKPASQETLANNQASVSEGSAFGSKTKLFSFEKSPQKSLASASGISTPSFGNSSKAPLTAFGQASTTQSIGFGQTSTTQPTGFGQTSTTQSTGFGQTLTTQSTAFGQTSTTQSTAFGQTSTTQSGGFGQTSTPQSPRFGQNTTTPFGQTTNTVSTSLSSFGQTSNTLTHNVPAFCQPKVTQSTSFGQNQTTSAFGSNKSQPFAFGQSTTQSGFGQNSPLFNGSSKSATSAFAANNPLFPAYGSTPSPGQPSLPAPVKPTPSFGQTSSGFFNQTPTTQAQTPLFGQQTSAFGSNSGFNQNSNPTAPAPAPAPFGQTSTQPFGQTNQFSFGSSSSSTAPSTFTTTPPNTNAPVFGFNSSTSTVTSPSSNFAFGSNSTSAPQTPFGFGSQTGEPFKFGAPNQSKETQQGFNNGSTPSPFAFGPQTANNNDPKPGPSVFSFGTASNTPAPSTPGFNFGGNVSTPVFSFGNSGSSGSSNSSFSFGGTPQPNQNPFGPTPTQTPSPFPIPGTFSIGSGTSQTSSRPRGTARLRRRP